jgi:group I intron endonuclease
MATITTKEWKDLEKALIANGGNLPGVYKITRKLDGKVYIGQTSDSIAKRIKQHLDNKHEGDSKKIDGAIQAEGWANFTYEVEEAIPEATTVQLWYREATLIAKYDSCNNGFNKTQGNHVSATFNTLTTKHEVSVKLTKDIRDHFKLDLSNKKVLLIGFFKTKFIDKLEYDNCSVTQISKVCETDEEFAEYIMEELAKYKDMKFDLIIANPPYGKIGANITKTIIDHIKYDEYINLLPANDYNRNDTKDLYRYVDLDSMIPLKGAFKDAAVTTHCARISEKPHKYISWEEFEIENYIDDSLTNYFYATIDREHYAIDGVVSNLYKDKTMNVYNDTSVIFGWRDLPNKHLPYSKACTTYNWNVQKSININDLYAHHKANNVGLVEFVHIRFNTDVEKTNFVNFVYSDEGFRFTSKVFTALNLDGSKASAWKRAFPKVDWTRSWTVEEILADYGYTQKEIDEVKADLDNFKGMED